jgi:LDH2 family malate/lactate/ureidoglycolate dehydrogenase
LVEQVKQQERVVVDPEKARAFSINVLKKFGYSEEDARDATDVLIRADLRGVETHGLSNGNLGRIYISNIKSGNIKVDANIRVVHETPVSALMDGDGGLGLLVGVRAMQLAIKKAQESYIGMVTVKNSRHYGMASYYSLMAADHGMIGMSMTNTGPLTLPTGGKEAVYGTNPISIAAPSGTEAPYCLDMGTSAVVMNKVLLTARQGKQLPYGVAADENGVPTTDPNVARNARKLLPLGGTAELGSHKGYGLGLWVDVMCGLLSGNPAGVQMERGGFTAVGHFFGAIRVDAFRPLDEFKDQMDDMVQRIGKTPPAEGFKRVYTSGEIEHGVEAERKKSGIPLLPDVIQEMKDLAAGLDIEYNLSS